jgi:hypothetical protein
LHLSSFITTLLFHQESSFLAATLIIWLSCSPLPTELSPFTTHHDAMALQNTCHHPFRSEGYITSSWQGAVTGTEKTFQITWTCMRWPGMKKSN